MKVNSKDYPDYRAWSEAVMCGHKKQSLKFHYPLLNTKNLHHYHQSKTAVTTYVTISYFS